jgi:hypothetical protein
MRRAPAVSEGQAKVLRLARDAGRIDRSKLARPQTLDSCLHHRWLAPRAGYCILTDGGRAALAHYDADEAQEELWHGARSKLRDVGLPRG